MIKTSEFIDISALHSQKAWLVFTNQTELPWLRFFKKGFRHCFVIIHDGNSWISIDPMANYMEVLIHELPEDFDLPEWLENRGHSVVKANLTRNIKRSAPIMIFTCVEACKRILGIHKWSIFTPWQLYKYLEQQQQHKQSNINKGELSWEV